MSRLIDSRKIIRIMLALLIALGPARFALANCHSEQMSMEQAVTSGVLPTDSMAAAVSHCQQQFDRDTVKQEDTCCQNFCGMCLHAAQSAADSSALFQPEMRARLVPEPVIFHLTRLGGFLFKPPKTIS